MYRMDRVKKNLQNLKVACAVSGVSMAEFARDLGISPQALDQVLRGKSKSRRIQKAIDLLIVRQFRRLRIRRCA